MDDKSFSGISRLALTLLSFWVILDCVRPAVAAPSADPEVNVTIIRRAPAGDGSGDFSVELAGEVTSDASADELGWRSMKAQVAITCPRRMDRFERLQVYSGHSAQGTMRELTAPDHWIMPAPGGYMRGVVDRVCGRPVAIPGASVSSAASVGGDAIDREIDTSLRSAGPHQTSADAPTARQFAVQIAASPSQTQAQASLRRLVSDGATVSGLRLDVQLAHLGGGDVYRAIVSGFQDERAAETFCASLTQRGQACFVRRVSAPAQRPLQ